MQTKIVETREWMTEGKTDRQVKQVQTRRTWNVDRGEDDALRTLAQAATIAAQNEDDNLADRVRIVRKAMQYILSQARRGNDVVVESSAEPMPQDGIVLENLHDTLGHEAYAAPGNSLAQVAHVGFASVRDRLAQRKQNQDTQRAVNNARWHMREHARAAAIAQRECEQAQLQDSIVCAYLQAMRDASASENVSRLGDNGRGLGAQRRADKDAQLALESDIIESFNVWNWNEYSYQLKQLRNADASGYVRLRARLYIGMYNKRNEIRPVDNRSTVAAMRQDSRKPKV